MLTNYSSGHLAEEHAAKYLAQQGYRVIDINWKTKWCEIDLVAEKDGVVYLIEVKYRKSSKQGLGFDYITPKKLKQMKFAAELWVSNHEWQGEYQLGAIEMSGEFMDEIEFVGTII
jgi:Holliday junction resolvase-like predicted endonuclease